MSSGGPDYSKLTLLQAKDATGTLKTVLVDSTGKIIAILQGQIGGLPTTILTDADGRIQAALYGSYNGTPTPVSVDDAGKLVVSLPNQSSVDADQIEAQTWDGTLTNLLNNMNRIRSQIIAITGEVWGTVSHSIATIWLKFHASTGHKHSGSTDDGGPVDHTTLSNIGTNTHAQIDTTLGALGATYAPIAKGVSNGDAHDHSGGDGAQINHVGLSNIGTNTHAQIDTHLAGAAPHSGHPKYTTGSYNGDNTVNRAIAHGLGRTPAIVFLVQVPSSGYSHIILGTTISSNADGVASLAVTAPDGTNFYVGNAADYWRSANNSGSTILWVAIG